MVFELTRRDLLGAGLAGLAAAVGPSRAPAQASPPPPASPARGKAKAVIQIWLWGGPSHLDTFDPKPNAGRDYMGPTGKAIPTNVEGIQIASTLPLLAKVADKYAILRGMTHGINAHETAAYVVTTGRKPGGELAHPHVGAVVTHFKAFAAGYKGMLPPYIVVTRPQGRFSEAGFLSSKYKPFPTGGDPARDPFVVEGIVAQNITEERQKDRRALLGELDRLGRRMAGDPAVSALATCQEQAYEMILGDAGKTFDLAQEKPELRDRYGRHTLGQSCLLARRLVERGVVFVTINSGGWDTHKQHFQAMARKLPELDSALSALLQDLSERGLLESTIVWVGGEFGRTPKVQWEPPWNGGRGHYGKAFSVLVAGGGFKGGRVVGKTDERGETVVERPIYPWDLVCSMYELLGIDHAQAKLTTPQGVPVPISPFAAGEIQPKETGGLLREIL